MPLLRDTLVIVDMQPLLPAAVPRWLHQAILALIEDAKAKGMAIVMLEYMHPDPPMYLGKTFEELYAAARSATHFAMRLKAIQDGSQRVADALQQLDIKSGLFRICGVNTQACIESTAVGLAELFQESVVEVMASACNDFRGNNWPSFAVRRNLTVVHP